MSGNVCVSENCTTAFHPRGIRFSQNVREMMVLWVPHDFFHVAPQFGNAQLVDFFVGQQDLMIFYGCTSKSWKKSKKSNPPSMGIWGPTCEPPRHLPGHRRNLHDRPRPHRLTGSDRLKKDVEPSGGSMFHGIIPLNPIISWWNSTNSHYLLVIVGWIPLRLIISWFNSTFRSRHFNYNDRPFEVDSRRMSWLFERNSQVINEKGSLSFVWKPYNSGK